MNEHAVLILLGLSTVATTISGFAGVVAVFGERAAGHWTSDERFRTTNMLILSLNACLFSFVPLTIELFGVPKDILWISSSLSLAAFCFIYWTAASVISKRPTLSKEGALINWVKHTFTGCLILAVVFQVMNVGEIFVDRGAGPFIVGLLLILIPAALQFAFLILRPLGASKVPKVRQSSRS